MTIDFNGGLALTEQGETINESRYAASAPAIGCCRDMDGAPKCAATEALRGRVSRQTSRAGETTALPTLRCLMRRRPSRGGS